VLHRLVLQGHADHAHVLGRLLAGTDRQPAGIAPLSGLADGAQIDGGPGCGGCRAGEPDPSLAPKPNALSHPYRRGRRGAVHPGSVAPLAAIPPWAGLAGSRSSQFSHRSGSRLPWSPARAGGG
jgi:hypothetical protein